VVRNKIDLDAAGQPAGLGLGPKGIEFRISASRGDGVPELISALVAFVHSYFGANDDALIGRARQRELLQQTADSLQRSIGSISSGEELAAEDLRMASHSLGRLLGRVDVEDILDVIFREFCIGK
jgi:tRNA modification GTPase